MSRRRFDRHRSRGMTKQERFQWGLTIVVFIIVFCAVFVYRFFANCIFEWPIRWNVHTCWNEQVQPAKEKAAEKAANFIP